MTTFTSTLDSSRALEILASGNPRFALEPKLYTLRDLYNLYVSGDLIPRPIEFQRLEVANDVWKGAVVYSALNREGAFVLWFRRVRRWQDGRLVLEVLDGQQRLTSLFQYLDNKKTIHLRRFNNKTKMLHSLPVFLTRSRMEVVVDAKKSAGIAALESSDDLYGTELAEQLWSTPILVMEFLETMTDKDAADMFGMLNNANTMNDQEKRNAIRGWIARYVRGMVRSGADTQTPGVPVESLAPSASRCVNMGGTGTLSHLNNTRMELEEFVARLFLLEHMENPFIGSKYASAEAITEMYRNPILRGDDSVDSVDSQNAKARCEELRRTIEHRFGLLEQIVPPSKKQNGKQFKKFSSHAPKSFSHWTTLYLFLMWLDLNHKGWKFGVGASDAIMEAFAKLTIEKKYAASNPYPTWNKFDPNGKATLFSGLLGKYAPHEIVTKCEMLLCAIQLEDPNAIRLLDAKRVFSFADKVRKWEEQGGLCAYTGNALTIDEAVGGHKIPHSQGGSTTYNNLVILSRAANQKMGTMTWEEFKKTKSGVKTTKKAA